MVCALGTDLCSLVYGLRTKLIHLSMSFTVVVSAASSLIHLSSSLCTLFSPTLYGSDPEVNHLMLREQSANVWMLNRKQCECGITDVVE